MKRSIKSVFIYALILTLLVTALPLSGLGSAALAAEAVATETAAAPAAATAPAALKDDFYAAINGDWLLTAQIPADQYSVGGFTDLSYEILDLLMADTEKMRTGEIALESELQKQFIAFYTLCADYDQRNADGLEPVKPYLEQIEAVDSLEALQAVMPEWLLSGLPLPLSLSVSMDLADAQQYALYASGPSLLLPDVSYYDPSNPYGPMLLGAVSQVSAALFAQAGYSPEEAERITAEALAFDAMLVPYAKTAEEQSDVKNLYNPVALAEFCAAYRNVDFDALIGALVPEKPEQLIVTSPRYFAAFDEVVCPENFQTLKSWMLFNMLYSSASYTTEDAQTMVQSVNNILMGQAEPTRKERLAYSMASSVFGPVVGDYYGRRYFGEEAKADVTHMVENMVAVYKKRLGENTWLTEATKAAAIRKLDTLSIQVGYPDSIHPLYEKYLITSAEEGGTVLSNIMGLSRIIMEDMFARMGTPVDRSQWSLSADTVNAMYSPQQNAIMFPAAILQAPFYSLEQSASANYGGIGAVIAHEISHAFDPNGALFDEYGSMANWWTDEDMAQFEKLSQDMIALFDGQPYAGGAVNGNLTKTENIADAGGLSCALEVAKALPDADLDAFFRSWATIWRVVYTPEIEQYLLMVDTHAPNKLRCNMQLPLLQEFYDTYGIQEGDGMYIAPEERVSIW